MTIDSSSANICRAREIAWSLLIAFKGNSPLARVLESIETSFDLGEGTIELWMEGEQDGSSQQFVAQARTLDEVPWSQLTFSADRHCHSCDIAYPSPEAGLFNFNSPLGACPTCEGFGDTIHLDPKLIVPDPSLSISEGAIAPWTTPAYEHHWDELIDASEALKLPIDRPFSKLTKRQVKTLFDGDLSKGYSGIRGFFEALERKKYKMHIRVFISRFRSYTTCAACHGARLKPEVLAYQLKNHNLASLCGLTIDELHHLITKLELSDLEQSAIRIPMEQLCSRLNYLRQLGLGYIQLDRPLRTLSGGEAQRTLLTASLGSTLVNMLYVLDEPSAGLHPADVEKLTKTVKALAQRGNTVLAVEHEPTLLRAADEVLEIGPGAGNEGGRVIYQGPVKQPVKGTTEPSVTGQSTGSVTLDFLHNIRIVPSASKRRTWTQSIQLEHCRGRNLKDISPIFPLGVMSVVTGVSGSGKSTLVQDTLYATLKNQLQNKSTSPKTTAGLPLEKTSGAEFIDDCILVDQSPVSRSQRSNPITYVKAFDEIRKVFAGTHDAKTRGFEAGHFSFNSSTGRCPRCSGDGSLQIDMQFLADVQMICPDCEGSRYRREILSVRYRDLTIADALKLTVSEACDFFRGQPKVRERLSVLIDVGLDYLPLGQSTATLSSGESQRLKLAGFLASASRSKTLFVLDEPTTGLHFLDVIKLLTCFDVLVDAGHSLVIVEHHLDVIAAADHVIDLGPGAGEEGGQIVAYGTPEAVAKCEQSVTATYLRPHLQAQQAG